MKAKDTVIQTSEENCHNTLAERLSEQAEITWKASINEVVDWLQTIKSPAVTSGGALVFVALKEDLAKLKEWGINPL